ncbi:MAG: RNA helicase [Candidatus Vogelbacteria bacterium CG10_big_fil_rev_8_21_14_0_10_49_38]|uniref:RNA helicase n=1 Tax=Candidatus Vogelbacteria bacterium CG10_big_fil_rev_8_21_14_0_10_49_38 TaxID=1975043 RepID=A0A2H0RHG2_9BACT|nr:MAG: hypothetical protein BK006_01890 [bacterium CG10_49_38]PIR46002.1 MAG: RNA helicase [Candidatus Vogelbacteria bacterium CG10_big_fil_rev_8_21_14_0_10_49_38]
MFKGNYRRSERSGQTAVRRFVGQRSGVRSNQSRRRKVGSTIDIARFTCAAKPRSVTEVYEPKHRFADFAINESLKQNILAQGYVNPTPIQDGAILPILAQDDVVGVADTGTGKTAAFLIPLLDKILSDRRAKVLVIVPTRELALQINGEFQKFRGRLPVFSVCCFGGSPIGRQLSDLRRSHNFIIGTPGRFKDLIERGAVKLADFGTIVLDEADRMLDMGFVKDMRFIMAGMAENRQTLLFSATISHEIDALIKEFLRAPVTVSVKTGDTSRNVDQSVVRIGRGQEKFEILHGLLKQADFNKVLIFGRTKFGVEKLSVLLRRNGLAAEAIHGDKNQSHRQRALDNFKTNRSAILVATDVAARGLDIPDVSHVINYDLPATYDDYVHRIGRTGRGDKTGKALTFIE